MEVKQSVETCMKKRWKRLMEKLKGPGGQVPPVKKEKVKKKEDKEKEEDEGESDD